MLTPSTSTPPLKIGIYRTSSLGDVVLGSACLDLLAKLPVPVEATWIGRGSALEIMSKAWPDLKTVEIRKSESFSFHDETIQKLSDLHVLVDLQCNIRSNLLARTLKKKFGTPCFSMEKAQLRRNRLILDARVRGRRKPAPAHVGKCQSFQFDMMLNALRKALEHQLPIEVREGIPSAIPTLPFGNQGVEKPWVKELSIGKWLAVAPGAAHETKRAPTEFFTSILNDLKSVASEQGLGLVFLGDQTDRKIAINILEHVNWEQPVLNLAGKLELWESAIALQKAIGLLGNDSSLLHISESVDTPVAVLFGPTVEAFGFAPRHLKSRSFSSTLGCRPCSKHGKVNCRYDDKMCFKLIDQSDVAEFLNNLCRNEGVKQEHPQRSLATSPSQWDTDESSRIN